jgi:AraC-like DNA-binding protein
LCIGPLGRMQPDVMLFSPTMSRTHVERHSALHHSWELATRASIPALQALVPHYIGYSEQSTGPVRRFEVPHPNVTVIINLGEPLQVHAPALHEAGDRYGSFVAGLFDTVAQTESGRHSAGIELNVTPLGMWQVVGVPMHELMNRVVPLDALLGRTARMLEDQLLHATSWDAKFALLDAALLKRVQRRRPPSAVRWAWSQLARDAAPRSVSDVARELQWSRRRLAESFREYVGVTPKLLARLVRFDRVVRASKDGRPVSWSTLAHRFGYADQAHLTREFREFSGLTPTEFRRRRQPGGLLVDC